MIEARITLTIQDLLNEYNFESDSPVKFPSVDELVQNTKDMFFDFAFPWYDMSGKEGLEEFKSLYLHKNFMKQIGQETVELHKLFLQSKLMERMPYYKQLFDTVKLEYNPLNNVDLWITEDETTEGAKDTTGKKTTSNQEEFSETGSDKFETSRNKTENETTEGSRDTNESGSDKRTTSSDTGETYTTEKTIADTTHVTEEAEGTQTSNRNFTSEGNEQSVTSENPEITVGDNDYTANLIRKQDGSTEDTNITANNTSGGTTDTDYDSSQHGGGTRDVNVSGTDNTEIVRRSNTEETGKKDITGTESGEDSRDTTKAGDKSVSGSENVSENVNEQQDRKLTMHKAGFEGKDRTDLLMRYREAILNLNEMLVNEMNVLFMTYYGNFGGVF